jgi:ABC-type nitrate/sulfonate/bicarbonate transport system substrate-binding protein
MRIKDGLIQEDAMRTRRSVLLDGLGSLTAAAAAMRTGARAVSALESVNVVLPTDSVFVLSWLGAKDAGIFAKHGIDLRVDVRPFAGFLASMPSKESFVGDYSGLDAIDKINEGLDWVILGPGLTVVDDVIVRKDAPFKTAADLRGKVFGAFSTAGSTKSVRAALIDAYNLDIMKDTKLQQIPAPALMKLLEEGRVDAMTNISSFTVNAEAEPDKFRVLFSPNDYWIEKTGYPITWASPLDGWRSWVNEKPTRAKNFAAAALEMLRWLKSPTNLRTAVKNYGKLAGITSPAAVEEYITWLDKKHMFMTDWDRKAVAAQWQFLELCKRTGVISKVPPMDKYALFVEG